MVDQGVGSVTPSVTSVTERQGRWRRPPRRQRRAEDPETAYVIAALEDAGATLIALPSSGYTTAVRCGMPEIVRDYWENYTAAAPPMRLPRPDSRQIARMDEALSWLRFIPADRYVLRQIVGARCLVHPVSRRPFHTWRSIGERVRASHEAVRNWHAQAIALIVVELRRRNFDFSA